MSFMNSDSVNQMLSEVGDALRQVRLQRNLSQKTVSERSGISFGAYRNLELGEGASLRSFLAVCRTLGKTDWIKALPPPMGVSPMEMIKRLNKPMRQRAGCSRKVENHG